MSWNDEWMKNWIGIKNWAKVSSHGGIWQILFNQEIKTIKKWMASHQSGVVPSFVFPFVCKFIISGQLFWLMLHRDNKIIVEKFHFCDPTLQLLVDWGLGLLCATKLPIYSAFFERKFTKSKPINDILCMGWLWGQGGRCSQQQKQRQN